MSSECISHNNQQNKAIQVENSWKMHSLLSEIHEKSKSCNSRYCQCIDIIILVGIGILALFEQVHLEFQNRNDTYQGKY